MGQKPSEQIVKHLERMQERGYTVDTIVSMVFVTMALIMDELHEDIRLLKSKCHDEHYWVGQKRGGDPTVADSGEWVEYCDKCGKEKPDEE